MQAFPFLGLPGFVRSQRLVTLRELPFLYDGKLVFRPGLHESSGIVLTGTEAFEPESVTDRDVAVVLDAIAPLYQFWRLHDRDGFLAACFAPMVLPSLGRPLGAFVNTGEPGKTSVIANVCAAIATGMVFEKAIPLIPFLRGRPPVLYMPDLDLEKPGQVQQLHSALELGQWSGSVLVARTSWSARGRVPRAHVEIWDDWRYQHCIDWIIQNRADVVSCLLRVIQTWLDAGCPRSKCARSVGPHPLTAIADMARRWPQSR